ncbi:MAG: hypothetical protein JRI23_33050 [Deltaproteobacteria bacterium]|jgi:hypothetical protein|nr:hypothetical protein [Deltaproteobacteria bacterium]MBW2537082.1 hypothetical protein [Deltaproteobacteria bacterium]
MQPPATKTLRPPPDKGKPAERPRAPDKTRGIRRVRDGIIRTALFREIAAIRIDAVWRMLAFDATGQLPGKDEEGATGRYDNKGAIFVPGGIVFEDSDRNPIPKVGHGEIGAKPFREQIRGAMRFDNATLVYPDGIATGVSLNNGFYAQVSANILAYKKAATRRRTALEPKPEERVSSDAITRSHCPSYFVPPYGSRTKLSSCLSVCLSEPRLYYVVCRSMFALRGTQENQTAWDAIRSARRPVVGKKGAVLAPPYIVVCHVTRHKDAALCGTTRILGIGKFGEFASLTMERVTADLLGELGRKEAGMPPDAICAEDHGVQVAAVLRIYDATQHGKRARRFATYLLHPKDDLRIDVEQTAREARQQYQLTTS